MWHLNSVGRQQIKCFRTTNYLNAECKFDFSYTISKIYSIQIKIKCEKSYQEENKHIPLNNLNVLKQNP